MKDMYEKIEDIIDKGSRMETTKSCWISCRIKHKKTRCEKQTWKKKTLKYVYWNIFHMQLFKTKTFSYQLLNITWIRIFYFIWKYFSYFQIRKIWYQWKETNNDVKLKLKIHYIDYILITWKLRSIINLRPKM